MDSSKIKLFILGIFIFFAAIYLGISAATAQLEAVLWMVGGLAVTTCLMLGKKVWLLLPLMAALSIRLPLPGTISLLILTQATVIGFMSILFLMRKLPLRFQFTELEFWCLLFCVCVAQVYVRNPVGLNIFGGSAIGGRAYFEFAMTLGTAFILSILVIDPKELIWWMRLTLIGSIANFFIGVIGLISPSIGVYLGASYGGEMINGQSDRDEDAATRLSFVRGISHTLAIWVASRMSPLKACFHPAWAPIVLFTLGAAAFSGFRSQFAIVGLTYLVGILYRGGIRHLIISAILGAAALGVLALVNLAIPLPPNVQRSLTFLPGTWDERYKRDASNSTDWRYEIWIEALTTDYYIQNKIIGDGLGMSAEQFQQAQASYAERQSVRGLDAQRANIMMSGDFHSGPVMTIRTIGYVGLLILIIGLVRLAVHAHRQIMRCRGTTWYPIALFIGIPIIWGPFFWVFIFGSFSGGATMLLMGTAMVRLMEKSLPLPSYVVRRREPYVLGQSHPGTT
jgi:hypothetical protein